MIRRRVIEQLREQQWIAVGIELLIVVLGVFIGLQASNWNQERASARQGAVFAGRLKADLRHEDWVYQLLIDYSHQVLKSAEQAVSALEGKTALSDEERFLPLGKKQVLRDIGLAGLDPALFDRPKSGFVLPIDSWARDVLRDEMTDALSDRGFCEAAGLDAGAVGRLWSAFLSGAPGFYWSRVWAVYVLGWWCREHRVSVS